MDITRLKEKIHLYLVESTTPLGMAIDIGFIFINILACVLYVFSTTLDADSPWNEVVSRVELLCVTAFIVDYLLRIFVAKSKVGYIFSFYGLIDLISILPVFSSFLNVGFLRAARIFRIFVFVQDHTSFFGRVSPANLNLLRLALCVFSILFVASCLIFEVESGKNPQFANISDAAYFTIVTVTTVGFGDITPITGAGRLVTVLMITAGVIFIPYHLGMIARQYLFTPGHSSTTCPSCGVHGHQKDAGYCRRCGSSLTSP